MASRSPFPAYPPEIMEPEDNQIEIITQKSCIYIDFLQSSINESKNLNFQINQENSEALNKLTSFAANTAPIIDRIGRFMSDLSQIIGRDSYFPPRRATL